MKQKYKEGLIEVGIMILIFLLSIGMTELVFRLDGVGGFLS